MSSSQWTHTSPISVSGRPESRLETTGMDGLLFSTYVQSHVFLTTYAPYPVESPQDPQPIHTVPTSPGDPELQRWSRSQEELFSRWKPLAPNTYNTQIFPPSVPQPPKFQLNALQNGSHSAVRSEAPVLSPFYR